MSFKFLAVAKRLAASPSPVELTKKSHLTSSDIANSDLDPETKGIFRKTLEVKSDFQSYSIDLVMDPGAIKGLRFVKDSVMEKINKLIKSVKDLGIDTNKFEKAARSLSEYELTSNVGEVNQWSGYAHELITAIFEEAVNKSKGKTASSKLVKIAFKLSSFLSDRIREKKYHIHPKDINESSMPDELKPKFVDIYNLKENFQTAAIKATAYRGRDSNQESAVKATDKLQQIARSIVFSLRGLTKEIENLGIRIPLSVNGTTKRLEDFQFIPNPDLIFEADSWAWTTHEVLSKLFDLVTEP